MAQTQRIRKKRKTRKRKSKKRVWKTRWVSRKSGSGKARAKS